MHRYIRKTCRGLTLIEIVVALFVFTLMMATTAQIFAKTFASYRSTRAIQRDIDNAQYSINVMAKELRTSTVVSTGGSVQSVQFFDHSQGKCFRYRLNGGSLQVASVTVADSVACGTASFSSFTTITTGVITGSFQVDPSTLTPKHVGQVTVALDISEGSTHHARIQTSVSLRDFGISGL